MKWIMALFAALLLLGCEEQKPSEFIVSGKLTGATCRSELRYPRYSPPTTVVVGCLGVVETKTGESKAFSTKEDYGSMVGKEISVVKVSENTFMFLEIAK